MTDKEMIYSLKCVNKLHMRDLKKLVEFFDAVQDAMEGQRKGHSDGWIKVQRLTDNIEDEIGLEYIREL